MVHRYFMGGKPRGWKETTELETTLTENHFKRTIQQGKGRYLPSIFAGYKRLLLARIRHTQRNLKKIKQAK